MSLARLARLGARPRDARPVVAVLHGEVAADAPADERDTLKQAEEVAAALDRQGYAAVPFPVGLDLGRLHGLRALSPALVFNLVEALGGDGSLLHLPACVLDTLGLPYTGAPSAALHATTDKRLAKTLMAGAGLPVPETWDPARHAGDGGLFIVKSAFEDASIGLESESVVPAAAVPALLEAQRRRLGGRWFAERFVAGREFNIPMLAGDAGPEILPIGEIDFAAFPPGRAHVVGYRAKWDPDSVEYGATPRTFAPAPGDGPLRARLVGLARAVWRLFGLEGYARIDLRVDREGRPWLLEANANPCLSSDAGYLAAAEEAGLDGDEVVRRIVAAALRGAGPAAATEAATTARRAVP